LATRRGAAVILSADDLREHHPLWQREARADPHAAERVGPDVSRWMNRLYADAIAEKKNVVFETSFKDSQRLIDTIVKFRAAQYRVEAIILAVDEERTKRSVIGRYLEFRERGHPPPFVTAARHQEGYVGLRSTVEVAEDDRLLDQITVVGRDGSVRFTNSRIDGEWQKSRGALRALDVERDRPLTSTEKVTNAIAWQALEVRAQHAHLESSAVIEQASLWRQDASERVLKDPEAAKRYGWKIAAESFRTMPREWFLREFPAYAGAVERLDKATAHAKSTYSVEQNRADFIATARERLANQIEDGRQFGRAKQTEEHPHVVQDRSSDEGRSR
jgi:hypothetical protein